MHSEAAQLGSTLRIDLKKRGVIRSSTAGKPRIRKRTTMSRYQRQSPSNPPEQSLPETGLPIWALTALLISAGVANTAASIALPVLAMLGWVYRPVSISKHDCSPGRMPRRCFGGNCPCLRIHASPVAMSTKTDPTNLSNESGGLLALFLASCQIVITRSSSSQSLR